jgi:hypothetical protein
MSSSLTRRDFHRLMMAAGVGFATSPELMFGASPGSPFTHPGILHSAVDFERMRAAVRSGSQPIAAGFDKLREHPLSSATYAPHKFAEEIGRNPSVNFGEFDSDANAAYQCALMSAITGEHSYATVSRAIVNGWSATLQRVSGADAVLMAGLGPFKFVNAAEILRFLGELNQQDTMNCAAMLRRAILPTIMDFAPFANGNWDTAAVKTMLAIAVFCDDQALLERALLYYLHGDGDGRLTHYIYENGQCQESGRDQQHTQLGLAHMGDACQIAWNQGWDLYGAEDNRLLRGFEFTAAYNLGEKVEFQPDVDRTGKYRHKVISPPSAFRPVYEQILAHYHVRRGLPAPAVQKAVDKIRPEGAARGADHTGFGTLLYARTADDPDLAPRRLPPAALHAVARGKAVELDWLRTAVEAPAILDRGGRRIDVPAGDEFYRDTHVVPARQYTYRLLATSPSAFVSALVSIAASLPAGWTSGALGNPAVAGDVQFDGKVITVCTAGNGLMQPVDEGHFVAAASHVSRIKVRFISQIASQFAAFGLACRSGFEANAPSTALLIMPAGDEHRGRGWHVQLMARNSLGQVTTLSDSTLTGPVVTYGRLMKSVWLRLEAKGSLLQAAFSTDASVWIPAGQAPRVKEGCLGLIAASGIPEVASSVRFELAPQDRNSPPDRNLR